MSSVIEHQLECDSERMTATEIADRWICMKPHMAWEEPCIDIVLRCHPVFKESVLTQIINDG